MKIKPPWFDESLCSLCVCFPYIFEIKGNKPTPEAATEVAHFVEIIKSKKKTRMK